MKCLSKLIAINLLSITTAPVFSGPADNLDYYGRQTSSNTQSLVQYVLNLGGYLGFDLSQSPTANSKAISQALLDISSTQVLQSYLFNTFLGAIPVNAFNQALSQFTPGTVSIGSKMNPFANYSFAMQNYNSPSSQQGTVSVSPLIDQPNYQQDPVSQTVLNIMGTPDMSYCMSYDGSTWSDNCQLLFQNKIAANAIGTLPSTNLYFSYNYLQQFISQLNSNTLTAPLMYSTESQNNANASTSGGPNSQNQGLTAQSQAQQALNFIRYASGSLVPMDRPKLREYDVLFNRATNADGSVNMVQKIQAQSTLARYFTNLRTYAAQNSVGIANLYYILSKRLPQNQSATESKPTSQALSEFTMATSRLYNPDMSTNKQWINQMNTASPATVQKEIAVLLAEINYQLYLNRQQEERMLLTNSLLLLQNSKTNQPIPDFASQGASN